MGDGCEIKMDDGKLIEVSRRNAAELKKLLVTGEQVMNNRRGIIGFAVILGFFLLPVFMWISESTFDLFMPNGKNFVLYKAVIVLLYAGYIFAVRKFILKISKAQIETKLGE